MRRFKNLLVHVSPESESDHAIRRAARLAAQNESRVTVMSCIEPLPRWSLALLPEGSRSWPDVIDKEVERHLDE